MGVSERLDAETRTLREEADAELDGFYKVTDLDGYRRYLGRTYGFIAPLERSLIDTPGLDRFLDPRRFTKRLLIEADLDTLGLKALEIESIPQCMWIPWFEDPHTALGWAYVIERNMNAKPHLFRHLAATLPGEAAFAASYLKCSSGGTLWQSFLSSLRQATTDDREVDLVVAGAKAGYRFFRRWRSTLDGRATSGMHEVKSTPSKVSAAVASFAERASDDDSETP